MMRKNQRERIDGILDQESARYADWNYVFDGDVVPLGTRVPWSRDGNDVFPIDMDRLRPIQFERLVDTVTRIFQAKRNEIYKQLRSEGFSIRATDVKPATVKRNFL